VAAGLAIPLSSGLSMIAWFDVIEERYDDMFAHADEALRTAITPFDREMSELLVAMALGFRGQIAESVDRLWGVRERCCNTGWTYITSATDMPLGITMALQGDLTGGVRYLEKLIEHNKKIGFVAGIDMARFYLAELYIMLLQSKELPPFAVARKNLRFLVVTMFSGWNKALGLVLATRDNVMFAENSHWRARTETDLGVLYLMKKRYGEANECLQRARPMAAQLQEEALLAKMTEPWLNFPQHCESNPTPRSERIALSRLLGRLTPSYPPAARLEWVFLGDAHCLPRVKSLEYAPATPALPQIATEAASPCTSKRVVFDGFADVRFHADRCRFAIPRRPRKGANFRRELI
jgi:hypothetical protein